MSRFDLQLEGQWIRKLCIICHGSEYCLLGADFYNNQDDSPTIGLVVKVRTLGKTGDSVIKIKYYYELWLTSMDGLLNILLSLEPD